MNTDAPPITLEPLVTDECRCPLCSTPSKLPAPVIAARAANRAGLMTFEAGLLETVDSPPFVPGFPASGHKRTIIALTGLAGSGKSTVAMRLVDTLGYARVRFAGPLKAMMAALGLTPEQIDGSEKEQPCALLCGQTPRLAMQTIGTEWGRNIIGPDLWINAWRTALDRVPAGVPIVVDDCRFPNEAEAVRAAGGVIVRIDRPGAGSGAAGHSSEGQQLGPVLRTIANTGSLSDLAAAADVLARDMSWATAGLAA